MSDWLHEEMPTRHLPGKPRHKQVREVKAVLWRHLRSRPMFDDAAWQAAWVWAAWQPVKPKPEEIATQYLARVLAEMKQAKTLILPKSTQPVQQLLK